MQCLNGLMIINDIEIKVDIIYIAPTEYRLGKWNGEGMTSKYLEPNEYETNIGSVIITSVCINNNGMFRIEFVGNGKFLGFSNGNT